jgi:proteasome lid subunit RPN8/RPN11
MGPSGKRSDAQVSSTDTSQIDLNPLEVRQFPGGEPYRVHISRDAHDTVWNHAREAPPNQEVGGILVGDVYRDARGPYLDIQAAIVAEHTRNEDTQLTFTPESWIQVNEVKDTSYPGMRIVGWYHTHPRFGIFLSDRDRFIQSTSFSQPWATALVVDPIQDLEGFFLWQDGEPKLAQEYWVGTEKRDKSMARPGADGREEEKQVKRAPLLPASPVSRAAFVLTVALAFLALILLFGYVYLREVSHAENEQFLVRALDGQRQMLQAQQQALGRQQQVLDASIQEMQAVEKSLKQVGSGQAATQEQVSRVQDNLQELRQLAAALQQQVAQQQFVNQFGAQPLGDGKTQPKQEKK